MNKKLIFLTLSLCSVTASITASSLATLRRVAGTALRTLHTTPACHTQVDLNVQHEYALKALDERFGKLLAVPAFWAHQNGAGAVFDPALGFDFATKEKIVEVIDKSDVKKTIYMTTPTPDSGISHEQIPLMGAVTDKPFNSLFAEKLFENAAVVLSNEPSNCVLAKQRQIELQIGEYRQRWKCAHILGILYHELGHIFYNHGSARKELQNRLNQGFVSPDEVFRHISSLMHPQELEADHFALKKGGSKMAKMLQEVLINFKEITKDDESEIVQAVEHKLRAMGIPVEEEMLQAATERLLAMKRAMHPPLELRIAHLDKHIQEYARK